MKIEAVIGPARLDTVLGALDCDWVAGLTVTEVSGLGAGEVAWYRGAPCPPGPAPRLRVEAVVPTPLVPRLLHALERALRGGPADELVAVAPVVEALRIRTGERGEGAL